MKISTGLCLAVAAVTVHNNGVVLPQADAIVTSQPSVCRLLTTYKGTTTCWTSTTTTPAVRAPWDKLSSSSTTKSISTTTKSTSKASSSSSTTSSKGQNPSGTTKATSASTKSSTTSSSKSGAITTTKSTLTTTTKSRPHWSFPTHFTWSTKFHFSWSTRSHPPFTPRTQSTTSKQTGSATTKGASGTSSKSSGESSSSTKSSSLTTGTVPTSSSKSNTPTTTVTNTKSGSSLTTSIVTTSTITISSSSSSSITSTSGSGSSSSSATSSSTTSTTKPSGPTFKISVEVSGAKLLRRFLLYLAFAGNQGQLVADAAQGADFSIVDGYLMVGGEYVTASGSGGYSTFSKSSVKPTEAGSWSLSGGQVSFGGGSGFCYTPDRSLIIVGSSRPSECTDVSLVQNTALITTTNQATTTTDGSVPPATTTRSPMTTGPTSTTSTLTPGSSVGSSMKKTTTPGGQWTTISTTSRTTTSSISCTEQVYTATSRCKCTWSVRCNSHAVSEFGESPKVVSAPDAFQCIELCNNNANCAGLYFEPRTSNCYIFDAAGDNVLYGYNTGPYIAASPLICDEACANPLTTRSRTTTSSTTTSSAPSGICTRGTEYKSNSGGCNCWWQVGCGTSTDVAPDLTYPTVDHKACVDICDSGTTCMLFTYNPYDGMCRIWYNADIPAISAPGLFWGVRQENWCPKAQCPPGS